MHRQIATLKIIQFFALLSFQGYVFVHIYTKMSFIWSPIQKSDVPDCKNTACELDKSFQN